MQQNPSGIILIDKPTGISSFGVVARVRGILSHQMGKRIKVGHTGTLDPFATGLMILVVGEYCKRAGEFSKLDKTYEATMVLSKTSTTGDPEGEITDAAPTDGQPLQPPTRTEVEAALKRFTGLITQIPPIYSAIKIDGQRAYKLAREGKTVEMPSRQVTIYSLELLDYAYPEVKIRTHVSSGTYIRTLAQDIGAALGSGAYLSQLRRTSVDRWGVGASVAIDDVEVGSVRLPG